MTPTEPGYYWVKRYQNFSHTILETEPVLVVTYNGQPLRFRGFYDEDDDYALDDESVTEWGPKINPPESLS